MSSIEKSGRVRVSQFGQSYTAEWRVVGHEVEITSKIGVATALLGGLMSAPATVAQEKFREMIKAASRPSKPALSDRARFNVRDA